jgi:hypothetical protein
LGVELAAQLDLYACGPAQLCFVADLDRRDARGGGDAGSAIRPAGRGEVAVGLSQHSGGARAAMARAPSSGG